MGLAASQCRLLMLTARKDDLEANLMSVANTKLALTRQTQAAAEKYSRALDTTKYQMANTTGTSNIDLTYGLVMDYTQASNIPGQYLMEDSSGRVVLSDSDAKLVQSISGSTGAGFSVTSDMGKAFLEKKMGITDAQASTYVSGYSSSATATNTNYDANAVSTAMSSITDILGTGSNTTDNAQSANNISLANYTTIKTNFNAIIQSVGNALKNMGATLGSFDSAITAAASSDNVGNLISSSVLSGLVKDPSDATVKSSDNYKNMKALYIENVASLIALEQANSHNSSDTAKGDFAFIKGVLTGQKISGGSLSDDYSTWHGGWLHIGSKHYSADYHATDAASDGISNVSKQLGVSYTGRCDQFNYSVTDYMSLLQNASTATPTAATTNGTTINQTSANFYLNQLTAMGSNGFVDVSYATTQSSLQNALKNQAIYLVKYQGNNAWGQTTTSDSSSALREVDDTAAQAKAEAEYKAETARLNTKEAQLDLQEKNYDTERSEVDTEIDSVKTILNKNIERSFKMFQA